MWVILVAAIVGMAAFLERVFVLRRPKVVPRAFVDRIRGLVAKGKLAEAQLLCEENESSIARLMVGALRVHLRGRNRTETKIAVDEIAGREISLLDKNVEVVGTVASVTPLLGLLGTVLGMIQVFQRFSQAAQQGSATTEVFAEGIYTALITTAYGLMVAIPMFVLYKQLLGRTDRLVAEMEEDAMGLLDLLDERGASEQTPTVREGGA